MTLFSNLIFKLQILETLNTLFFIINNYNTVFYILSVKLKKHCDKYHSAFLTNVLSPHMNRFHICLDT